MAVRKKPYDTIYASTIRNSLTTLKTLLLTHKINSFRMSRQGKLTDTLDPGILSEALIDIFK